MANSVSDFVNSGALSPQRIGGNSKFYELTSSSVTPTRVLVDAEGNVIEERVPVHYSQLWVGVDGCVKDVPMRTSAVFSMEPAHAGYEQIMTADMIRGGQLPLHACPWTHKYSFLTGGTLARSKSPGEDCGGKPDGCEHMKAVIAARLGTALKKREDLERVDNAKSEKQIMQMAKTIGVVMSDIQEARASADPKPPKMKG